MTKQSLKKENFALVLVGGEKRGTVLSALRYAGWLEFRVDEFLKRFSEGQIAKWLSINASVKRIGTVRGDKEHQENGLHISEERRLEIYRKIITCIDYVDVEIKSSIAEEVANYTRKKKEKIIASYHNFSKTPSCKGLEKIYRQGIKLNPDIIKIATSVRSAEDMLTLLSFTHRYSSKIPLVVIPMGVPAVERLVPIYFGSLFTYVSLEKQTAPGQISYKHITWLLDD